MSSPTRPDGTPPEAGGLGPAYFGIGCITAIAGFAGGGMIAVLVAKIVGALGRCAPDAETGAPCGWGTYWLRGALIGLVLLPSVALWRFRRGRQREQHTVRG
jgi:hypothetical protein